MRDTAAAARALRAEEYETRFLRPVEVVSDDASVAARESRRAAREPRARAYGSRVGTSTAGVPGRRTVQITGQTVAPPRRQSASGFGSSSSFVARPDRTAMWAFLLALFLVLMAVATASAGT
jgi:hypothetical protein